MCKSNCIESRKESTGRRDSQERFSNFIFRKSIHMKRREKWFLTLRKNIV
jgi:hypothetical protein